VSGVADDPFVALFSESAARAIVTVPAGEVEELRALSARHDVLMTELGTAGGDALVVDGAFDVSLDELRTAWTATLPAALGA
jgi:phosphoribosylformylglycinamidine (FGAM) synthase-like enzyme